jgi:hypothetical protein
LIDVLIEGSPTCDAALCFLWAGASAGDVDAILAVDAVAVQTGALGASVGVCAVLAEATFDLRRIVRTCPRDGETWKNMLEV